RWRTEQSQGPAATASLPPRGLWLAASCSSRRLLPTFFVPRRPGAVERRRTLTDLIPFATVPLQLWQRAHRRWPCCTRPYGLELRMRNTPNRDVNIHSVVIIMTTTPSNR